MEPTSRRSIKEIKNGSKADEYPSELTTVKTAEGFDIRVEREGANTRQASRYEVTDSQRIGNRCDYFSKKHCDNLLGIESTHFGDTTDGFVAEFHQQCCRFREIKIDSRPEFDEAHMVFN